MSIRRKIILYFSVVTIVLLASALFFIYTLFASYREEEFQQRQVDKIATTLKFLTEIKNIDEDLIEAMDRVTIHDLYDEKLLIFDQDKQLLYSSIDDTPVNFSGKILGALSVNRPQIEQKDGRYDVTGIYLKVKGTVYYGISKAYDISGYSKLDYLRYVLSFTLIGISLVVVLVAYYLSRRITHSIEFVARQINDFSIDGNSGPVISSDTNDEIAGLVQRFNELMSRTNEAFAFQKHAVHHISHELKTPIAVLVSNFERLERETDPAVARQLIQVQKENTRSLGEIINSLLEIAKMESGNALSTSSVRVDEIIFDLIESFSHLYPNFRFSLEYADNSISENNLAVPANSRLLKSALSNLMQNCIQYSRDNKAQINIAASGRDLRIELTNLGPTVNSAERAYLFQHFFRGENSKGKRGFGLGLVFTSKILTMHKGSVSYSTNGIDCNTFSVVLPLS